MLLLLSLVVDDAAGASPSLDAAATCAALPRRINENLKESSNGVDFSITISIVETETERQRECQQSNKVRVQGIGMYRPVRCVCVCWKTSIKDKQTSV